MFAVVLALIISIFSFFIYKLPPQKLQLLFFDIGQGDGAFFRTPGGKTFLVDGGPYKNILDAFGKNLSFWDRSFNYVIMTHPDRDHYEGLIHVLERYEVKRFLMPGILRSDPLFQALIGIVRGKNIPVSIIDKNSDFTLPDGTQIDFLFPEKSELAYADTNTNLSAIVFLLTSPRGGKILFTADIDTAIEQKLLPSLSDIGLLKVAHHGSRYGSSKIFLEKTKPEAAVISVGKNRYGHPHPDTLQRLIEAGVRVYRTDVQGTVELFF